MIVLKKILDVAIRQELITDNSCRLIKKLSVKKEKMQYWTIKEFLLFDQLFNTDEQMYRLFFHLAFFTGMRKGEILALIWADIDMVNGQISVNKTVSKIHGKEIISEPKTTSGNRTIAIHKKLLLLIKDWKEYQLKVLGDYVLNGSISEIRIFEDSPFKPLDADRLRKKYISILKRSSQLTPIRIHDFRHSHVALLINQNEKPYVIKERLGHASIQNTYDIYGHLYPSKQRSLADSLNDLY